MVWESGCVVIVMLTPLSENGVKQCHHYWPDEGSDVYHIYEVRRAAGQAENEALVIPIPHFFISSLKLARFFKSFCNQSEQTGRSLSFNSAPSLNLFYKSIKMQIQIKFNHSGLYNWDSPEASTDDEQGPRHQATTAQSLSSTQIQ